MLKISDILKKTRQPASPAPQNTPPATAPAANEQSPAPVRPAQQTIGSRAPAPEIPAREPNPRDRQEAQQLYERAIVTVRPLLTPYADPTHLHAARDIIAAFSAQIAAGNTVLLELFFTDYPADAQYLANHSVNVCILCLALGGELSLSETKCHKVALAALLHDVGLTKVLDIICLPRVLRESERAEVRKHPLMGKDLVASLSPDIEFEVFDGIQQEHERIDGSGYPFHLKENEISETAKLVAVADVYEALTHRRPHRPRYAGRDGLRQLLDKKQTLSNLYLKSLINLMGVFPFGTPVELNTRETGVVVGQKKNMPLRPTILITHNAQQHSLSEPKRVDLATNFSLYIKRCISS